MSNETRCFYEFGPFRLDERTCLLWADGRLITLEPKIARTLLVLVRAKGALVEKENLIKEVWEGVAVTEHSMTRNISILRKTLKDGLNEKECIETVPTRGYRFVVPVTERWEQPQSSSNGRPTQEQPQSLPASENHSPQAFPVEAILPANAGKNRNRFILVSLAILLVVSALSMAGVYYSSTGHRRQTNASSGLPDRQVVGVLGFRNLSQNSEDQWLSAALPEWLNTELVAGGKLQVISGEDIARMKKDLALQDGGSYSAEAISLIRKNLGVGLIIDGSYVVSSQETGKQIRLDLRVLDASTGQTISSLAETGNRARLFDFIATTGSDIREKLGLIKLSLDDTVALRASIPKNEKVGRLYIDGVEKLRQGDVVAAHRILNEAVDADPEYPLSHFALSAAWSTLGYEMKARQEAKLAMDLSPGLTREECLAIEANYGEINKDWNKAIKIYEALWLFARDNIDYGLHLTRAQISGGKGQDALNTLRTLRNTHAARSDDPRIDYLEAKAAESLGDFPHELAAADHAITRGREQKARRIVAQALIAKGWALDNMGKTKEAVEAGAEAQQIFAAIDDQSGVATALKNIGDALIDQGKPVESLASYRQALDVFRKVENQAGIEVSLNNIALVLKAQGNLAEAKKTFGESAAVCRMTGDKSREASALDGMAVVLWREGNLRAAITTYEKAYAIFRENGDQGHAATVLSNIALALEDQGNLAAARAKMEEALSVYRQIDSQAEVSRVLENIADLLLRQGDLSAAQLKFDEALKISQHGDYKSHAGYALVGLAEISMDRGDLIDAGKKYEEALKLRTEIGEKGMVAENQLDIALLRIEEGRFADAESLARQAAEQFRTEGEVDDEANAFAILAKSLLLQGKVELAQHAIDSAMERSKKTENRGLRLFVATNAASVRAANGGMREASGKLISSIAECRKYGYLGGELEARLALGELELRMGKVSEGRAHLFTLEKDATAKGFKLIAAKAAASRRLLEPRNQRTLTSSCPSCP